MLIKMFSQENLFLQIDYENPLPHSDNTFVKNNLGCDATASSPLVAIDGTQITSSSDSSFVPLEFLRRAVSLLTCAYEIGRTGDFDCSEPPWEGFLFKRFERNKRRNYDLTAPWIEPVDLVDKIRRDSFEKRDWRITFPVSIHTGEKPYSCSHCPKAFARGSQLTQHLRTHTKDRPFTCPQCNSDFVCRNNLLHHIKRHQGERDYVCHKCGKSFIRRDSLQKHLAWFHANLKAFECKICNKRYKGHLLQHMRIHKAEKPHKCSWCDMRFVQRSQLTVHERTHSGIRPYRCAVCHMAFAHSTALKMHVRRHTGEKPFKCLICDNKAFSQLPHLKKHMLSIHKTNKPYYCIGCKLFFQTKIQLQEHQEVCTAGVKTEQEEDDPVMPVGRMRLLLAILLQKISTPEKLEKLGFGKRLIDHVLTDSIEQSGRTPCLDPLLTEAERLRANVQILLDWTVPKVHMDKFKSERRSMEELLEEFTNLFIYE
ncbi:hypothetical protein GE061_003146 [Apolygus lucorum]|uniref:C2H2-type domain-containing protein n=1 Tax=Apolygus lucorum TaxID=248454 RepID=A0A8S9X2Q3_APOLU|nr:hypothetical protein GE061_003146 [Apolygus lucorum]